jgi:hypothetical protein
VNLRGSEHGKAERGRGAGHACVVGDDGRELVAQLECGRQMQSVERIASVSSITEICATTACACAINCGTRRRTARMTSTSTMALASWSRSPASSSRNAPVSTSSTTSLTSADEST